MLVPKCVLQQCRVSLSFLSKPKPLILSTSAPHIVLKLKFHTPRQTLKRFAGASTNTKSAQAMADLRVQKASPLARANDNERTRAMPWVKRNVIEWCSSLSLGETERGKTSALLSAESFAPRRIRKQEVKKMVVECYAATSARFKTEMAAEAGGVPRLHLSLDLWVDKLSTLKYIGEQERVTGIAAAVYLALACVTMAEVATPLPVLSCHCFQVLIRREYHVCVHVFRTRGNWLTGVPDNTVHSHSTMNNV